MTAPVLVSADGLRVTVDGRALVDGVGLRVRRGRVTALVGPSGSGKTTTALALLGEYPPGAQVGGAVTGSAGPIGYLPQHPATVLNPARRVGVLLRDIARRTGAGPAAVEGALRDAELAGVEGVLRRFPHQLSGGQQQRVVLAQALLLGARVIVADEPTTGQDARTKGRLTALLRTLAARGTGILLLSHDLGVVAELADEVVVLEAGRVRRCGPPSAVLDEPAPVAPGRPAPAVPRPGRARPGRRASPSPASPPATPAAVPSCTTCTSRSGRGVPGPGRPLRQRQDHAGPLSRRAALPPPGPPAARRRTAAA